MKMDMSKMTMMSNEDMMLKMMNKRFWIALALCSPLLLLGVLKNIFHQPNILSAQAMMWLELVVSIPVVFWAGSMFFAKAGYALLRGHLNMFTLVVMGVLSAWLYSLFAMFMPNDFPASFHLANGGVAVYFDAACYITIVVLIGHIWEMKGRKRIRDDINKLSNNNQQLHPHLGNIMNNVSTEPLKIQKYIDKVAEFFIFFVIILALASFAIWYKFGPSPSALYGLIIAITVLLSACPCVFTLATPLSIMCGINKAAEKGILIKNPDIFQIMAQTNMQNYKKARIKFAMGSSDTNAIKDAEIIILSGKQEDIMEAIKISKSTMDNIKENIIIGAVYNLVMLPIAAGALYPTYGIFLGPIVASIAMSASSIVVVLNALRLKIS